MSESNGDKRKGMTLYSTDRIRFNYKVDPCFNCHDVTCQYYQGYEEKKCSISVLSILLNENNELLSAQVTQL